MIGWSLPEPGEKVRGAGHQVEGVHGVSDHLRDGPGKQKEREANGGLRGREEMEYEPGDVDPGIVSNITKSTQPDLPGPDLLEGDLDTGPHQAQHGVQDLQQGIPCAAGCTVSARACS